LARRRPDVLLAEKAGNLVRRMNEDIDMDAPETGEEEEDGDEDEEEEEADEGEGDGDEIAGPPKPMESQLPRAANGKIKTSRGRNERVVAPEECRAHLRQLFRNEAMMCSLLFGRHGPFAPISKDQLSLASADMFFLDVIPVAPTRFRPPAKLGEVLFEHPQNELLSKVLNTSYRMRDLNLELRAVSQKTGNVDEGARKTLMSALLDRLVQLQVDVNSFMDSSKNPAPVRQSKLPPAGVKQGLEKKEGLFRKHMMVRPTFCGMILLLHLVIF
jgi:DNA-directed RNA polymerase beta' subunit